jgi:N-acetylglucosaminyldiphosphoundecaprenol N-acetyl-beta-D-mannosaminyltransferase
MNKTQDMPLPGPVRLGRLSNADKSDAESFNILGVTIAATTLRKTIGVLTSWLEQGTSTRLVTFANVHMLTEAYWNPSFLSALRQMDMNCPDGMPLVWIGKLKGNSLKRVAGPDFMPAFCSATASKGYRHFFYGGKPGVAEKAIARLRKASPGLQVAGWYCPPFGEMSREEDDRVVQLINDSAADIVWVCLGCPKQEVWGIEHRDRLNARIILSVGLAFDIVAGLKGRAPWLLRASGLEWLYRMLTEPKRLAGRYLLSNSTFLYLLTRGAIPGKKIP